MKNSKIDFLYLNEQDMVKAGVTDMSSCISTMEEMFKLLSLGDYRMGGENVNSHGMMISFPNESHFPKMPLNGGDRRFMAMPAYLGGDFDMAGMKWYGSNLDNREKGLPRSILTVMLNDKDTGAPVALMSANLLSAYRTGAVPGVAAKYLAKKDSRIVGIIGPGVMNKTAFKSLMCTCPQIDTVKIYGRGSQSIELYIEFLREEYPLVKNIEVKKSMEEAIIDADIVSIATSTTLGSENYPYIKEEWIKPGALFCIPATARFDNDFILNRAINVVDNIKLYEAWASELPSPHFEYIGIPAVHYMDLVEGGTMDKSTIRNIGDIITGKVPGRKNDNEVILFSIGGMPVEDVAWGTVVYRNAVEKGIGTKLNLWDKPLMV